MKKIVETKIISEDETKKLQEYWFSMEAMKELISKGITQDIVIRRYELAFTNFNQQWESILKNNFEFDYSSTSKYNWECDFSTRTITITEE